MINGHITLEVLPNHAHTLTTMTQKGGKGKGKVRPAATFPHLYTDSFEACPLASIPKMVAPMAGAFDCVNAGGGHTGVVVRQSSPAKAICDRGDVTPYAVLGDGFRTSYNISIDYLLPASTTATPSPGIFIGGRAKGPVGSGTGMGFS